MNDSQRTITSEDLQKAGKGLRLILEVAIVALVKMAADVYEAHERTVDVEAISASPPALNTAELDVVKGEEDIHPLHAWDQPGVGEFWPSLR